MKTSLEPGTYLDLLRNHGFLDVENVDHYDEIEDEYWYETNIGVIGDKRIGRLATEEDFRASRRSFMDYMEQEQFERTGDRYIDWKSFGWEAED